MTMKSNNGKVNVTSINSLAGNVFTAANAQEVLPAFYNYSPTCIKQAPKE